MLPRATAVVKLESLHLTGTLQVRIDKEGVPDTVEGKK
jgi:hypothetical protein